MGIGHRATELIQFWWICYGTYCLSMIGAKVSVGLSLLRYTAITQKSLRCITNVVICTSVVMGLVYGLLAALQCNPVPFFWTRALGQMGTCLSMDIIISLTYVMSAIFAACDFCFALLPVFLIKGLNMSRNQKFALIPILSMACIASSAVIVRLAYVQTFRDPEFLYATVPIAIWSEVEMSLAITAGSLPTLRPLYRIAARKFSWKTSFLSAPKSYKTMDVGPGSKVTDMIGEPSVNRKGSAYASCSESERTIVHFDSEEFMLEDYSPTKSKFIGMAQITSAQMDYGDDKV
ncbi:integral membrane protein [Stemphylium lycopersici]|uniref:Integral membrane protein n=1 Tax=Stemphylium lycopersici TaxID=183478 RepID=A0A364MXI8_STELY|nr:integral membrane protein [Stemphylium lycopersici]RAR06306.1 integral membrane protein [Stemphylium lycopersici]